MIEPPAPPTGLSGSGGLARPAVADPSATANVLPWHGRTITPSATDPAVQVAENASCPPAVGRVGTTSSSANTVPPPGAAEGAG
ncbi:MAG: hypothetical protein JNM77_11280, partial [Pseudonocardia sp.]|nr:hypothetical protein [Pseudonocardia sp.]